MAGKKAQRWLQEERRKTLGDWVAFCPGCGHTLRFFAAFEDAVPETCPSCGKALVTACPGCGEKIASAFAVDCEACGTGLRPAEWHGVRIRRADG